MVFHMHIHVLCRYIYTMRIIIIDEEELHCNTVMC